MKPTLEAASELLALAETGGESAFFENDIHLPEDIGEVARKLQKAYGASLVAVTDGKRGCGLASPENNIVVSAVPNIGQKDTTGCGDAYLGGLVSFVSFYGLPADEEAMHRAGTLASAAGAACCEILGALPTGGSKARVLELCADADVLLSKTEI